MGQELIENKMNEIEILLMEDRKYVNDNPKIKVIGVGGAGNNIVNDLYLFDLSAELVSINTDWKQLSSRKADQKILIGMNETKGQGCGGDIIKGKNAAIESNKEIKEALKDTEMIIFVGGLGRGTATGALPEIASYAKKMGALTVAFLTVPFFTLRSEIDKSHQALEKLDDFMDTTILLDNNKLVDLSKDMTLLDSFTVMNEFIHNAINSLVSLIRENEIIEIDYSNLKSVLDKGGFGTIGLSRISKSGSFDDLVENALNKNLSYLDVENAKTALVKVMGDSSLNLNTVNDIAEKVKKYTSPDAEVLVTAKTDDSLGDEIKIAIILAGISLDDLILDKALKNLKEGLNRD
jgi:cell division protein FtsZ